MGKLTSACGVHSVDFLGLNGDGVSWRRGGDGVTLAVCNGLDEWCNDDCCGLWFGFFLNGGISGILTGSVVARNSFGELYFRRIIILISFFFSLLVKS